MGLYLVVFDDENELDGVEIGLYKDFEHFRINVMNFVEDGKHASKCPTLMLHSDCDGIWNPSESALLKDELKLIESIFKSLQPIPIEEGWQQNIVDTYGLKMKTLFDCFFDVDGTPLIDRIMDLCELSISRNLDIVFQ